MRPLYCYDINELLQLKHFRSQNTATSAKEKILRLFLYDINYIDILFI